MESKLGRQFCWLNAAQFLGALNDNIFKLLVILFLVGKSGGENAHKVTAIAGAVFVVPFLAFIPAAGTMADRFSKTTIIRWSKFAEIICMLMGCAAFYLGQSTGIYVVLFFMAMQSAFFGPCKYGVIPELVEKEKLSKANGVIEAFTYLAIIFGSALAVWFSLATGRNFIAASFICVIIACVGFLCSFGAGRTEPAGGDRKMSILFIHDVIHTLWLIRRMKYLLLTIYASAYFLLIGGLVYANIIPYGMQNLGLNQDQSAQLYVAVALGIGLGALLAGRLSGRNVEFGIVPLGAFGMAAASCWLAFVRGGVWAAVIPAFLVGVSGGLFIVPLHAFMQWQSPKKRRGEVLAASSFLGWTGVILSSGIIYVFCGLLGVTASQMFAVIGIVTGIAAVVSLIVLPDFLVRFICIIVTKIFYWIRTEGIENVPLEGGVLLVSNHASWVDALLLISTQQRRIRFVMDKSFYNRPLLKPICKLLGVIPISAEDSPKEILRSLKEARQAMDEGFMVCIFAEGAMTRSGMLRGFKEGFERIMKGSRYAIIPVYIGGTWGSVFSYYYGRPMSTLPKSLPVRVSIHFGKAMRSDARAFEIRQKVQELSCDYFDVLKSKQGSLGGEFIKAARKHWRKHCMADSLGMRLSYGETLTGAVMFAGELRGRTEKRENVGVLLPSSVAGAIANIAIGLCGRVSVNISYTVSAEVRGHIIDTAGVKMVITSRKFLEKLGIDEGTLPGVLYIEDFLRGAGRGRSCVRGLGRGFCRGGFSHTGWVSGRMILLRSCLLRGAAGCLRG